MTNDELLAFLKEKLKIKVSLNHTQWPNGCGGDLEVSVRLYLDDEVISEDTAFE
jgi:hypothetical protein